MQKKYKNYEIKSTTHNKRWKLYKDDEELFVAPSLSDITAYIQIEERGVWQDKYQLLGGNREYENEPVALLTHPETGEQVVANVNNIQIADAPGFIADIPKHTINPNVAKPLKRLEYESHENKMARIQQKKRNDIKKPVVKKKTSMKMKKK